MQTLNFFLYILIIVSFALILYANVLSSRAKSTKWYLAYAAVCITYLALSSFVEISDGVSSSRITWNFLFFGFGIMWPQVISRLIIQQKIEHPVLFLKNRVAILPTIIIIAFLLYMTIMMLLPNQIRVSDGEPIFDKEFFYSRMIFLLAIISGGILYFLHLIQRTAFCGNGLLYMGILIDWASIKACTWQNDKIYDDPEIKSFVDKNTIVELKITTKTILFPKEIRLMIPYFEKEAIENLLNNHVN